MSADKELPPCGHAECADKEIAVFKEIEHALSFEVEGAEFSASYPYNETDESTAEVMLDIIVFAKEKARATGKDVYIYTRVSTIADKVIVLDHSKELSVIVTSTGTTKLVRAI